MRALRKLNNNVVVCVDGAGQELIAMGKGLGFGTLPRDLNLSEVERTFYDISSSQQEILRDLPAEVVDFSTRILDTVQNELPYQLSASAPVTLADHIAFSIQRLKKGLRVQMPLAYDIEQLYPAEYKIGLYTLKRIQKEFKIGLPKEEAVGIAMNLVNARMSKETVNAAEDFAQQDAEMLEEITERVEDQFHIILERTSFNYARYATHLQYLFRRIHSGKAIQSDNQQMYQSLRSEFPEVAGCVDKIAALLESKWSCQLSEEEKLYLMLHINRVCTRE